VVPVRSYFQAHIILLLLYQQIELNVKKLKTHFDNRGRELSAWWREGIVIIFSLLAGYLC
jgi:hypothetical protein